MWDRVWCALANGATTRSITVWASSLTSEGQVVLMRSSPATSSTMKRSCPRHTHVFHPLRRLIVSIVPAPSTDESAILSRRMGFHRRCSTNDLASNGGDRARPM